MVGLILVAQLTSGIDSGPHIVVYSLTTAVLHVNTVHVRNPGRGTHVNANRSNGCPFACDH